ncbi:toxin-antitoxin system HicB family antitoxin [Undibacterium sp. WLHG33]
MNIMTHKGYSGKFIVRVEPEIHSRPRCHCGTS